ncbi:hypothetical protein [Kocuria massiliensis]|uniref:hypothetical protein n=1 Tax=Kocuria massiliensis TaxID=1926282 RepID=UPI000A1CABA7|nr:hypothetical protein [Kocuria massiliensis]
MNLQDLLGTPESVDIPTCSRRGCSAEAAFRLEWNNPSIHTPDRRKVWLACPEHRVFLEEFLGARGFLKETIDLGPRG